MKLTANNGDFLEIEAVPSDVGAHDVLLVVRARFRGFSAEVDVWVQREAWMGFTQDLVVLEERRQGEAKLEGVVPGELALLIRSTNRAGHMGAEAALGAQGYDYDASMRFRVLGFDPSQLPSFVHGARAIASFPKSVG
jgi:hypothetical protein